MRIPQWIITAKSLVSDETFGPYTTNEFPDNEFLEKLAHEWGGNEGSGDYNSTVNLNVEIVHVEVGTK